MKTVVPVVALVALAALGAWLGWQYFERRWLESPIEALAAPVVFEVPRGASLSSVAAALAEAGYLERPRSWIRLAKRKGVAGRLKAGEYRLQPGSSPATLLDQFVAGDVVLHALTVPEGWTFRQALAAIQAHPQVTAEMKGLDDAAILDRLGLRERHPEGLFFPDTYRFARGTTDLELLRQAHARLERELAQSWSGRSPRLPVESPYKLLILASLVEKETGAPDERPLIAGVFVNRLERGMRLQTDPTVIYGLGEEFDGNLRRRDLESDTAYNTYTRSGLPPTPIALAGRAALMAAAQPADTDALYFVATGLGDGRHFFADTLAEHNANVARHLANLRRGRAVRVR
jgi:UPF0755 protein